MARISRRHVVIDGRYSPVIDESIFQIRGSAMTDLRLFDLNLLIAFDALMEERNVTRASRRLGIGQPAMSYALARLRELFGDDLFIRTATSMQPTTRALELSGPIARIISDIRESVLADRAFRPDVTEIVFRIGASDYAEVAVLPEVLTALRSAAPKARIAINSVDGDQLGPMIESGAIDLAIGYFPDVTGSLETEVLFHENFVCLFDEKACGVSAPLKLKTYLDLPHFLMSSRGDLSGCVDGLLAREGAQRFVFVATPHFLAIPFLLHGLRAAAAVPRRLAENCADVAGLAVSPLPVEVKGFDVVMLWHARTGSDPAQRWIRDLVRKMGGSKMEKPQTSVPSRSPAITRSKRRS
jgi:LysR family transcriptional activator of mexEF-oprN operon